MIKREWLNALLASAEQTRKIDHRRRLNTLRFVNYFVAGTLLTMAIVCLGDGINRLSLVLSLSAAGTLINALYVSLTPDLAPASKSTALVLTVCASAMALSGGFEGTGLHWLYAYPSIIYLVTNSRVGLLLSTVVFLLLGALLSLPFFGIEHYSLKEISRFLMSWMFVSFVLFISEHFNNQSFRDMSHINEEKQQQANTDPLTQLPNRRFMDSVYFPSLSTNPIEHLPITLAVADIDHFKNINDQFGHDIGDEVLCRVAGVFQTQLRASDMVIRLGGEEFLIILPNTPMKDGALVVASLRAAIASDPVLVKVAKGVTLSFGLAGLTTLSELSASIKQADQAMYKAKSDGRDRIVEYRPIAS